MAEKHFVVIGSGPAGNQAARTLRDSAPEARVTMISKSRETCYSPHLLPDLIAGKIREEELFFCSIESYKDLGVKLRCCQEVVGLNAGRGEVILEHKEIVPYNGLIIAVGSRPHIPERLLAYKDLMFHLKTLEDARVWIDRLRGIETVLLIGGDLISLAVARALIRLGKKVSFLLSEEALWPLRYDEDVISRVAETLSGMGVEVLSNRSLTGLERLHDGAFEAVLDEGVVRTEMVGAFFGLVPDIAFLTGTGLRIDRGILVDEYLNTGLKGVFATGDCAQIYHPRIRTYWTSIGHENARVLGNIAALNLACEEVKAKAEPESIFTVRGINVNTSWWTEF